MPRKHAQHDWIMLAAAGVVGVLTGAGSANLGWAEQVALAITVGLTVAVLLQLVLRLIGGKRGGP